MRLAGRLLSDKSITLFKDYIFNKSKCESVVFIEAAIVQWQFPLELQYLDIWGQDVFAVFFFSFSSWHSNKCTVCVPRRTHLGLETWQEPNFWSSHPEQKHNARNWVIKKFWKINYFVHSRKRHTNVLICSILLVIILCCVEKNEWWNQNVLKWCHSRRHTGE